MLIAVITDTHFSTEQEMTCGCRHTGIAADLLQEAVSQLNQNIKPDLTILLGDLINDGNGAKADDELKTLLKHLRLLDSPFIALPGNHDGTPEYFYGIFPRPPAIADFGQVRFVSNIDAERPGYNAYRSPEDLALLQEARGNWEGQIVSLQHVPILPPGKSSCPYHYENDQEILQEFQSQEITLAISGHYHAGVPLFKDNDTYYLAAPALCEKPFPITLVKINENQVSSEIVHL
jgi:predicted phosphodiesterase